MIRMHPGQWDVPSDVVARLVAEQFPAWRGLPVRPVTSGGTVNALFRLGDRVVLRFALRPTADPARGGELRAAGERVSRLAARLTVRVPVLLGVGVPGEGYPGFWAAYEWLPGEPVRAGHPADSADPADPADPHALAADLAAVVRGLRSVPTGGLRWDGHGRGGPLAGLDAEVRRCLGESAALVDAPRLRAMWDECLAAVRDGDDDVWIHADLMPGNLLVRDGRLTAVIDWEGTGVGDPAVDLMPAWNLLPPDARETFRREVAVDDATWLRGRGWALAQAVVALPYYLRTNEHMVATARHTLAALLAASP